MEKQFNNLNTQVTEMVASFHHSKKYEIANGVYVHAFEINSLLYVNLETFIKIVETVTGVNMPLDKQNVIEWLKQQIYVEDLSSFSPIKYAVCTNFLDEKLLDAVKDIILQFKGTSAKRIEKEKDIFDLDDADLYRKILEDDDFLFKQLRKNNSKQITIHNTNDPLDVILNKQKSNVFSEEDFMHLNTSDIFSVTKGGLCLGGKNEKLLFNKKMFNPQNINPKDISDFHFHQRNMIAKGIVKPFSKPRGKQMDHVDTADRPFMCKVPGCNRAFKRVEHLKRHNKMHTGEKPFVCKFPGCSRGFSRSDNLNAHYKTHNISQKQIDELNSRNSNTHNINFDSF